MCNRLALTLAACLLAGPGLTWASPPDARGRSAVLPPESKPFGQSYGAWAADWWRWAIRAPNPTNPVLDTTGEHCAEGQRGPVWFLAGTFDGSPVVRQCTVPAGRALFFPIVNIAWIGFPTDPPVTRAELLEMLAPIKEATGLEVTVDGQVVPRLDRYLVTSPIFSTVAPADNIMGVEAGTRLAPCLDQGFYVMLRPLAPGLHTVTFRGESAFGVTDATYQLLVREASRH